ncbi:MAG: rhomboid family intramembrane serine protease [Lewinellaceae bacterium]|nr:rhomboid family intramembrane serine protease [Saprospiraceae bacterium]MCB9306190.1 rhomboid family intramembrane serine protease [Lewinellaceae bacterium]
MPITYIIIAVTALISFTAFNNHDLFLKLKHWPYQEERNGEYYRWLSSGFLHADPLHLIFNMLTLYFFGGRVESLFGALFPGFGPVMFMIFYLVSIVAASSATFVKFRNTPGFASIGASGAVAAVLFAAILFEPTIGIGFLFIPFPIPGFIFGVLYLWYSSYAANKGNDNIDHTAHFFGAVFGFFFPMFFRPELFLHFVNQLIDWF